jgi:ribonucleoside-diphosphate reductase alpha chain
LAAALDPSRDKLSKYLGVITNKNRYALRKQNGDPIETPQFTHMRIAMGLSFNEKDPTKAALDFYKHMSNLDYLARVEYSGQCRWFVPAAEQLFCD